MGVIPVALLILLDLPIDVGICVSLITILKDALQVIERLRLEINLLPGVIFRWRHSGRVVLAQFENGARPAWRRWIVYGGSISTWLFQSYHATWPIGVYIAICSAIAIVCTMMLPDYTNKEIGEADYHVREGVAQYPALERIDIDRSFDQMRAAAPLNHLPLMVLSADRAWGHKSPQ